MRTRSKSGFGLPARRLNLTATTSSTSSPPISPLPSSYKVALLDPNWFQAMKDEYDALLHNQTWSLIPRPSGANVVSGKWVFRHKFNSDGSLSHYKAHWVCHGDSQQPGIDFDETFSLVVKPSTIRAVLSIAVSSDWPIHQLDVKNAFLHGSLTETVYCRQPLGFADPSFPDHVCHLQKSLYGLKQAPRAWFQRFATFMHTIGFLPSRSDSSLFIFKSDAHTAYLLLYVDDIVLTASSSSFLEHVISSLRTEFCMTDLGHLHHFLVIAVSRSPSGLFLSQRQYALDILSEAGMLDCHPMRTPADTGSKLSSSGEPLPDATLYRSLTGALQYMTLTRARLLCPTSLSLYARSSPSALQPRQTHSPLSQRHSRPWSSHQHFLSTHSHSIL